MSLDLLISKYLDSDLTLEEDNLLRELLKDDIQAKSDFDAAVILNAAFKEDAELLKVPAEIVSQTEDIIMMRILSTLQDMPSVVKHTQRYRYRNAIAFFLVVLVIGGIFAISEISHLPYQIQITNNNEFESAINENLDNNLVPIATNYVQNSNINSNEISTSDRMLFYSSNAAISISDNKEQLKVAISPIETIKQEFTESIVGNDVISEFDISEVDNLLKIAQSTINNQSISTSSEKLPDSSKDLSISSNNAGISNTNFDAERNSNRLAAINKSQANSMLSSNMNRSAGTMPTAAIFDPFSENTDIVLTTFLGTDVLGKFNEPVNGSGVNIYSQSISYGFSTKSRIGLEVGSIEYDYVHYTYIRVPAGIAPSSVEGLNPIGNDDGYMYIPILLNRRSQTYWGAALWDYNLYDTEYFALQSRIAIGASSDGMLVFARIFGQLHLYKGFYLTLGSEARGFDGKISSNRRGFMGTSSIIYGLQFKF